MLTDASWTDGPGKAASSPLERRLRRAEESRDWCLRLLSVLTHEMSQPLTVLSGEAELALAAAHTESAYREALQGCATQAERLGRLVERVRELARAEGPAEVTKPASIREAVRQSVELIRPLADTKQVTFVVEAESDLQVAAPHQNLRKAIGQVLEFLVDRSPQCGEVRVNLTASPPSAVCRVIDPGLALPPEELALLLDPLTRDSERRLRFTDIRLEWCLAKRMIQAWGGAFGVESGPEGCSVSLSVPLWKLRDDYEKS
jgi:signal transduction histidine kinase